MNLKVQTDFALRTLLLLAHTRRQMAVDEIAGAYDISKEHLFKVIQQLARMGYVRSKAGRSGGVALARDPASIRVDQVVGAFEGRNGVLACVTDPTACRMEPGCVLRTALIDAEEAFYATLAKMTIADVVAASHPAAADDGANKPARPGSGVYNLNIVRRSAQGARPTSPPLGAAFDPTKPTEGKGT